MRRRAGGMAKHLLHRASRHPLSALAALSTLSLPSQSHPLLSTLFLASPWLARGLFATSEANTFIDVGSRASNVGFYSLWPNFRSRILHGHSRKLLAIMYQRTWDATVELDLVNSGIYVRPNIVDQVMACIPSAKLALQFFIWAGEQIGYPALTSPATCDIVQWYAHKRQLFPFLTVLKGLKDPHFFLSPPRVNVLLQGYGWAHMPERAFSVMLRTQGFSNDMLVKCFLYSIMRQYRYDMVYGVYMELKKQGTCFDLYYNELIQGMALADGDRWQEADLLFKRIKTSGHILEEKTCDALIVAISRAGQHERASELLEDMMKKKIRLANATVSAVIESLCNAKEMRKASRVIEEVKQHGFVVDSKVYKSFLEALGGQTSPEK